MKDIGCPYVKGGIGGLSLDNTAALFIERYCLGCPYHEEVSEANIGRGIVERLSIRADDSGEREAPAGSLTHGDAQPVSITLDPVTVHDATLREHLTKLLTPAAATQARDRLISLAGMSPHLFGPSTIDWLLHQIGTEVGSTAVEILSVIRQARPEILPDVAEVILPHFERYPGRIDDHAIRLLAMILSIDPPRVRTLSDKFLTSLFWLVPTEFHHPFPPPPQKPNIQPLLIAICAERPDSFDSLIHAGLAKPDSGHRVHASALIERLADIAPGRVAAFLDPLLDALCDETGEPEYEFFPDAAIASAVGCLMALDPQSVFRQFRLRYGRASRDSQKTMLQRSSELARPDRSVQIQVVSWLLGVLMSDEPVELRLAGLDALKHPSWKGYDVFTGAFDRLVGALASACAEEDAERERGTEEAPLVHQPPRNPMDALGAESQRLARSRYVRELAEAINQSAPANEIARQTLVMLKNSNPRVSVSLTASLLHIFGRAVAQDLGSLPDAGPVLLTHLVNPNSHLIRGAAARACEEIAKEQPNALGSDLVVALGGLLFDQYLYPCKAAVRAFAYVTVPDKVTAQWIARILLAHQNTYASDVFFLRDLASAWSNLAADYPDFRQLADALLVKRAAHQDYYARSDALDSLAWRVKHQPDLVPAFVRATLQLYRDFQLNIVPRGLQVAWGESDHHFFELFKVPRRDVRTQVDLLRSVAESQAGDRRSNLTDFADLATYVEEAGLAATWYDAYAESLSRQVRHRDTINRYRARALHARAEVDIAAGNSDAALEQLKKSLEALREIQPDEPFLPLRQSQARPSSLPLDVEFWSAWVGDRLSLIETIRAMSPFDASTLERSETACSVLADAYCQRANRMVEDLTDEQHLFQAVASLLTSIEHIARWCRSVLYAESEADRFLRSGRMHAKRAHDLAIRSGYEQFAASLSTVASMIEQLAEPDEVSGCVAVFSCLALPVPRFWTWADRRRRIGDLADDENQDAGPKIDLPETIGVAEVLFEGQPLATTQHVVVDQLYRLRVGLNLAHWPDRDCTLQLTARSTVPDDAYTLSGLRIAARTRPDAVEGYIRFNSALAESSPPIVLQLAAEVETRDGARRDVPLFGESTLRFAVRSSQPRYDDDPEIRAIRDEIVKDVATFVPPQEHMARDKFVEVLHAVLRYAAIQRRDPYVWDAGADEKAFQLDLGRDLARWFDRSSLREVLSGRGFVDVLVGTIPIELKNCRDGELLTFVEAHVAQAAAYVVAQNEPAGFLCVLDLASRPGPYPGLRADVLVKQVPTQRGLRDVRPPVIVTIVVRGRPTRPSDLG